MKTNTKCHLASHFTKVPHNLKGSREKVCSPYMFVTTTFDRHIQPLSKKSLHCENDRYNACYYLIWSTNIVQEAFSFVRTAKKKITHSIELKMLPYKTKNKSATGRNSNN